MFTRATIVLLLVLNLGVAAWWWLRPAPSASPAPPPAADVPRLRLVGEAAPPPAKSTPPAREKAEAADTSAAPAAVADAPATEAPAPPVGPPKCFAFGPFADRAEADAARAALQPRSLRVQLRTEAVSPRGHWDVLLPPQADRDAAQAMAKRIEAAGFKDYYLIGEGASANGIALGRFGSEDSARRHQAALQAAGFAVQVQGPPAASRFWLDVAADADFDADAARRTASAPRVQPVECGTPG